jgi:hypothetical protein
MLMGTGIRFVSWQMALLLVLAAGTAAVAETANLGPVYWNEANERWRDVATNPYASTRKTTYDYASAAVTVTYDTSAPTFTGTLSGSNLKPNFAYQLKLNGKPAYLWGADGNDGANEQLGYAGRWWVNQIVHGTGAKVGGWNSTDQEYEQWKAVGFTDGTYDYVFEGYLLFDYFVTGADGAAAKPLGLNNSLHVLWKTSQRAPTANDSVPTIHTIVASSSSSPWYSKDYPTTDVGIYGEWEPGRALPGPCTLPSGLYNVRLFLTEESFHETAPGSGSWATVMTHDSIVFMVTTAPSNHPPVANNDSATTQAGLAVTVAVLANDTDPDGDALTVTGVTQGANGTVVINNGTTVTYTPKNGFSGTDTFTYTISDGQGGTATATVSVTVKPSTLPDIYGRITNQTTGAGISGITVKLEKQKGTRWTTVTTTTTDASGHYQFVSLALGTYRVTPSNKKWIFSPTLPVTVVIGGTTDHKVVNFTARPK